MTVTPTLLTKHLSTPFLARSPFASKGLRYFMSNLRSLSIPPATAAKKPLPPGTPQDLGGGQWAPPTLSDKLKQRETVTLAQVASSLAGGYFCHASPWLEVKEASVSWVNAPREACGPERGRVRTNRSSRCSHVPPQTRQSAYLPAGVEG